jgi:RHS repeat-associated protein
MNATSGISEQILSLPKGGSVKGLGETFEPHLHTGAGSYSIPLDVPNGANDVAPKLTLLYSTGTGNTMFGMGFSLNLYTIGRSTEKRIPTYDDSLDQLVLVGGGELIDKGDGSLIVKKNPHNWQVHKEGQGFRLTDRDGTYYRLGVTEQAQLFTVESGVKKVFQWLLEEKEDPMGNKVSFSYERNNNQLYLSKIEYSIYSIAFHYEDRPDPVLYGKAGFLIRTDKRCKKIELHLENSAFPLVRSWELKYKTDFNTGGLSLLSQVIMKGFKEGGTSEQVPPLNLDYTRFQPRRLEKFTPHDRASAPGGFSNGRRELIDWNGNGLPDLIEIGSGRARVWENRGNTEWKRPRQLADLPVPITLDQQGVAFADMEGNGTADLVMLNRPLSGYYPHKPGGGFDMPVLWRQSPSIPLSDPDSALVDLDGDGIVDLLVTRDNYFSIYLRSEENGWNSVPKTTPKPQMPSVNLRDPHVYIADMTGDGSQDLVRVDGSGVTFWVNLGHGKWSQSIKMNNRLDLPLNYDPERLYLTDINGDGVADFVYVDFERVIYWLNQGGTSISSSNIITHTPPANLDSIRLADMKGSGTSGVLWSYANNLTRTTDYLYLDFLGGTKPYLLTQIDNGLGSTMRIEYSNSSQEAQRDDALGNTWQSFLPFSIPVVKSIEIYDQVTNTSKLSIYNYHDGHYDGKAREFAGFGRSETIELGDDSIPALQTINHYHLGLDPENLSRNLPHEEAERLKLFRGRLIKTEIFGLKDGPDNPKLYLLTENLWDYRIENNIGGQEILFAFLKEAKKSYYEGEANLFRVQTENYLQYDENGNPVHQEQMAVDPRDPSLTKTLQTIATFAKGQHGNRFTQKPARVIQKDEQDNIIATTISYYDGQSEGNLGEKGLLTQQRTLVLTDDIVQAVYANNPPDFNALGYFRMPNEPGWWIDRLTYSNGHEATGLSGTTTNALGNTTQFFFDELNIHPVKVVDAMGNVNRAVYDYRSNKVSQVIDANNITVENKYDALGRLSEVINPGASSNSPSITYNYQTLNFPVSIQTNQRAKVVENELISQKMIMDGFGNVIEEKSLSGVKTIVKSQLYNARGFVKKQFLPHLSASDDYQIPDSGLPHQQMFYDEIGRIIKIIRPDGAVLEQYYEPGVATLYDEEDTNEDPLAKHKDTSKRYTFDPTGRVAEVMENESGQLISTKYRYDAKGNLLEVTNAMNQTTIFKYDMLGRRLQVSTPESGTSTFVFDANGNQRMRTDARGEIIKMTYDKLDRLIKSNSGNGGKVFAEYTYDDQNNPSTLANSTSKGRLVKVEHEGGEETFFYDEMGEIIRKTIDHHKVGLPSYTIDYSYRHDGNLDSVTLPNVPGNPGRLVIRYEYDAKGRLLRIPDYIKKITYAPNGLRQAIEYANGIETKYVYSDLTLRLLQLDSENTNNGSILQDFAYQYDKVGNVLSIQSSEQEKSWLFEYDDLYRLISAKKGINREWQYSYNHLGDFLHKSDVGDYVYNTQGQLVTVDGQAVTYTDAGQMEQTPWGTYSFDEMGRLTKVEKATEAMNCAYNQEGKRVWMKVDGVTNDELFTPDPMLTIKNGIAYAYIFDGDVKVAQIRLDNQQTSFLHNDHLGSLSIVTSLSGDIIQEIDYAPFGEKINQFIAHAAQGIDYAYTGQLFDEWAELTYLNSRYYNPKIGRFISTDTIVSEIHNTQAWNRYSYVQNNPLRYIDPSGHFWKEIGKWFKDHWKTIVTVVVSVAVIVAAIVISVVSFGTLAPLAGVLVGLAIGGLIGGLSAAAAGGDVGDILLGILVGAAVGAATSLAGAGIGVGLGAGSSLLSTVASGALSGSISGAGAGFVAGFASGGSASEIWEKVWKGAIIGFVSGAILGLASHYLNKAGILDRKIAGKLPTGDDVHKSAAEIAKSVGQQAHQGGMNPGGLGAIDPGSVAATAGTEAANLFINTNANSGVAILSFLKPEYIGLTASAFNAANSYVILEYGEDLIKLIDGKIIKSPKIEF